MIEAPPLSSRAKEQDEQFALVLDEVSRRLQSGESADLDQYAEQHPDWAERLRRLLPAMQSLAELGLSVSTGSNSASPATGIVEKQPTGVLGDYRILREIGRGGMGVVYEAEQISLGRRVALKVLPMAGVLDDRHLIRFRNEARAAASLKHANIVGVHAVGCERGVHYYAMEYVEGKTLAEVIADLRRESGESHVAASLRDAPAPGSERPGYVTAADTARQVRAEASTQKPTGTKDFFRRVANLGIQAADGLEHAHQMGIVHRDIKPSNLMVNASGHLWITDFGLAQIQTDAGVTMTGDVLGTLRYMSPEQASGRSRMADHHTDIYSLGVTLYELLALRPPFSGDDRQEVLRQITDADPAPLRHSNRAIPRDLETIVLKAMAKEPAARYVTAQQIADDLKRFLAQEPIRARPPTLLDRSVKWSRRHRAFLWAGLLTLVVALLGFAVSTLLIARAYRHEGEQRRLAEQQRGLAEEQRTRAEQREAALRRYLYEADVRLAHHAWKQAELARAREILSAHVPKPGESDLRGFEWHYVWALCHQGQTVLSGHTGEVYCVVYSPDGKLLASTSQDRTVKLWDVVTRQVKRTLTGHTGEVCVVAFSPDGATLATGDDDRFVKIWETATGKEVATLTSHTDDVFGLAFSPDGTLLASGGCDDTVKLWNTKTWQKERVLFRSPGSTRAHTDDLQSLAFSPDGKTLATASSDATIGLWNVATGKLRGKLLGHGDAVLWVTFSHDGRQLATASEDRTVRIWNVAAEEGYNEIAILQGHTGWVQSVAFSPDDRLVASASKQGTVRVWDVASRQQVNAIRGHTGRVWCAAFSPDGKTLATAGADGTVKLWDATAPAEYRLGPRLGDPVYAIEFAPDNTLLVYYPLIGWRKDRPSVVVRFVDPVTGREVSPATELPEAPVGNSGDFSADGGLLAIGGDDARTVSLWDPVTAKRIITLGTQGGRVDEVTFSPDGQLLAAVQDDDRVVLWDVPRGREHLSLRFAAASAALTPDGRTLALGDSLGAVTLLNVATGQQEARLHGPSDDGSISAMAFSPDGSVLAAGGKARVIRLWAFSSGKLLGTLVGHADYLECLAFSPDGKTLASGSRDETVRIWSVTSGRELLRFEMSGLIKHLEFAPDGRTLAGAGDVGGRDAICLWSTIPAAVSAQRPSAGNGKSEPTQ